MSVNTASNGPGRLLLMAGERVVDRRKGVEFALDGNNLTSKLTKKASGEIYLTTSRIIFLCKDSKDLHSFSADFRSVSSVELEQPLFGANYVKCIVKAEAGGGWEGTTKLRLTFSSGGAIEFGRKLLHMQKGGTPPVELPPTYDTFDYNPYGAPPAPYYAPPYTAEGYPPPGGAGYAPPGGAGYPPPGGAGYPPPGGAGYPPAGGAGYAPPGGAGYPPPGGTGYPPPGGAGYPPPGGAGYAPPYPGYAAPPGAYAPPPPPGYGAAQPPPGYTAPPNYVYDAGPSSSGAGPSYNAGADQAMYSDNSNTVYVHTSNNEIPPNSSAPPFEDKKTK